MQPFILVAAAGSLRHIQDMGFKTFNEFWDESYDLELDHKLRFEKIMSVIKFIASWTEAQRIEFTYKIKDIVEYNVNHLNSIPNIEIDNFVEKYGT
jgi:hypothetical protein